MFKLICKLICKGEGLTMKQLLNKSREVEIVYARQLIMYFAKEANIGSLAWIGSKLGKNHATVSHSWKVINNYVETDKVKRQQIAWYAEKLGLLTEANVKIKGVSDNIKKLKIEISRAESKIINLQLAVKGLEKMVDELNL